MFSTPSMSRKSIGRCCEVGLAAADMSVDMVGVVGVWGAVDLYDSLK